MYFVDFVEEIIIKLSTSSVFKIAKTYTYQYLQDLYYNISRLNSTKLLFLSLFLSFLYLKGGFFYDLQKTIYINGFSDP